MESYEMNLLTVGCDPYVDSDLNTFHAMGKQGVEGWGV